MKSGLLDYIFSQVDFHTLNRQQVKEYLAYLNEIINKDMSADDRHKFLKCKVDLNKRLLELDIKNLGKT
ncbi:hypothetical protein [Adhaeribacter pallidiroseus]|uniref:Uncharacterized protein n=1 Tax=Adhaeribacter pallidiroseus TaxID=2072847 RepID=A0A369QFW8_9BACT|nr:hypothetical protein [Adhaeribacter pallidiroseus]RDC63190.1 hypothetical protein AHMF7616_01791 [Adhaeribacter pallidiroseus]